VTLLARLTIVPCLLEARDLRHQLLDEVLGIAMRDELVGERFHVAREPARRVEDCHAVLLGDHPEPLLHTRCVERHRLRGAADHVHYGDERLTGGGVPDGTTARRWTTREPLGAVLIQRGDSRVDIGERLVPESGLRKSVGVCRSEVADADEHFALTLLDGSHRLSPPLWLEPDLRSQPSRKS
jgi:hypothetical protein